MNLLSWHRSAIKVLIKIGKELLDKPNCQVSERLAQPADKSLYSFVFCIQPNGTECHLLASKLRASALQMKMWFTLLLLKQYFLVVIISPKAGIERTRSPMNFVH